MKPVLMVLLLGLAAPAATSPSKHPFIAVESRVPSYEKTAAIFIKVPAYEMDLGFNNEMYRCWKLRLTGEKGKQVRLVLEQIRSVQRTLKTRMRKLDGDLIRVKAGNAERPLSLRINAHRKALDLLLERFNGLLDWGRRHGLLKISEGGVFSRRTTVIPLLRNDDYTMVYDDISPSCPPRQSLPAPLPN